MNSSPNSVERSRTAHGVVAALVVLLMVAAAGCGSRAKRAAKGGGEKTETAQKAETSQKAGGSKGARTGEKSTPKSAEKSGTSAEKSKSAEKPEPKPVAAVSGGGRIELVDRGCLSFEPHWTTIRVGQSLTWHSHLKKSVTIHVPPGVFQRDEFVVPAKGTVHSGPAQDPGDHAMWSMPAACQAAPHGVQGAGPGVTIEE